MADDHDHADHGHDGHDGHHGHGPGDDHDHDHDDDDHDPDHVDHQTDGPAHHGHGHAGHVHAAPSSQSALFWALLLTLGCMAVEAVGGLVAGSLALLADAAHMLTDAAALAMSYAAVRAARMPASGRLSYGHHRWQVLAAFTNGLALMLLAVWVLYEASQRLLVHPAVQGGLVAAIAVLGLASNLAAYLVLSRGETNLNVRGAIAHVVSDMMGSGAALVAGLVILASGWMTIDPLLSALVAALMIRSGLSVARESAHILLEGAPEGLDPQRVEKALRAAVPALESIHHLHSWSLADQQTMVTLHAKIKAGGDSDLCIRDISRELERRFHVRHATIQIEWENCLPVEDCELHRRPTPQDRRALPQANR